MGGNTHHPSDFQSLIIKLQQFWADYGCVLLQPYDVEMGAGTFHPATALGALGKTEHRYIHNESCADASRRDSIPSLKLLYCDLASIIAAQ